MQIESKITKQVFDGVTFKHETFIGVLYESELLFALREKFKKPKYLGEYWSTSKLIYMSEKTYVFMSLLR